MVALYCIMKSFIIQYAPSYEQAKLIFTFLEAYERQGMLLTPTSVLKLKHGA